jgi:hypothetical protein
MFIHGVLIIVCYRWTRDVAKNQSLTSHTKRISGPASLSMELMITSRTE